MQPELVLAYRRYFPLLVRKCTRMLRDGCDAQDLAQETFLRLHASEVDLNDGRAVTAWLYRTSTRLAIDRLRRRAHRTRVRCGWCASTSRSNGQKSEDAPRV